MQKESDPIDVTVIGGGLAGMAASIHLADAGMRVLCIEANPVDGDPVGESLDWSAPELLRRLGLSKDHLLKGGIATNKRHVVLKLKDGSEQHYVPGEWLGRSPYKVDLRTLHVDRTLLNQALREIVLGKGVRVVSDRVVQRRDHGTDRPGRGDRQRRSDCISMVSGCLRIGSQPISPDIQVAGI